jgi:hypothetical protein
MYRRADVLLGEDEIDRRSVGVLDDGVAIIRLGVPLGRPAGDDANRMDVDLAAVARRFSLDRLHTLGGLLRRRPRCLGRRDIWAARPPFWIDSSQRMGRSKPTSPGGHPMFIAMNRFHFARGSEAAFEHVWLSRDSHLDKVPGFVEFHLTTQERCPRAHSLNNKYKSQTKVESAKD